MLQKIEQHADSNFVVSSLTALEVMVKPKKDNNAELIARYQSFLDQFQVSGINDSVMLSAIDYRLVGIKTPDAIHLACANHLGCDQFWTNDNRLAQVDKDWIVNVC